MNKLNRPIADLKGVNQEPVGSFSGVAIIASRMKNFIFLSDEKFRKLQDRFVDALRDEESGKKRNHKEIIRVLLAATKKKIKGQKQIQKKVEKVKEEKPLKMPEVKPTAPKAEAPVTVKPPTPTPTKPPVSATPVPSAPVGQTAVKIAAGTGLAAAASTVKAKIAGKESAGSSAQSYNIMNIGIGEKAGKDNVFKLTEMTIPQVLQLAEERGKKFNKSGMGKAAGKYQFMPATLKMYAEKVFGKNWTETKYTPENQELLMDALIADNAKALQRAGVPVSDLTLYAMHFTGSVEQSRKISTAPPETPMTDILSKAAQNANPTIAKKTVGQYRDWLKSGNFTFQEISIVPPQQETVPVKEEPVTGAQIQTMSANITNTKKDIQQSSGPVIVMQENNNTIVNRQTMMIQGRKQELNPTMR